MKKKNLFLALGLAGLGLTTAQAQVIATLGFEDGDQQFHDTDSAQFATFYGDHINLTGADVWNEKATDAHSGSYALSANNSTDNGGQTWHRGFKMRRLAIEPGTSYRVSFWVKANPTYTTDAAPDAPKDTQIKSSLSIGRENFEAPFLTQSGEQYWYNFANGMTGDWRKISFVAYYSSLEVQNKYITKYNNNIKEIIVNDPEDLSKNDTIWYAKDETSFPETFFLTINMYNPGEYLLDDIVIEKASMAGCTYNIDAIKVDFGYPTNLAALAKAATDPDGTLVLPTSCVKVMNGDQEVEVSAVEGKTDGYLYIFIADENVLGDNEANIRVSFTPAADCPIKYTTDKRPSLDVESEMTVLGFADEAITLDETVDVLPSAWDAPKYVSAVPENGSFELVSSELKEITFTYNKELDLASASATLTYMSAGDNYGKTVDLTNDMSLSDDGRTVIVAVSNLADGEYKMLLEGVANAFGIPALEDTSIEFAVGTDSDTSTAEDVYAPDFNSVAQGTFPVGWVAKEFGNGMESDPTSVHEYGLTEDGQVWNYEWGGNKGGGGARMFTGFSGDFTAAIYWRGLGVPCTCTFGEQVKDHMDNEGNVSEEMDPAIGLKLDARKYQISFLMAAWKAEPRYDFTLEDLEGNVVARFDDILAQPNVNGQKTKVVGATRGEANFVVPKAGYYMLKFTGRSGGEFLMANVKLMTMPSNAAYNKQLLKAAIDEAKAVLELAAETDYDGATKTALGAEVAAAEAAHFTAPSAVEAEIAKLKELGEAMTARIENIDNFRLSIVEAETAVSNLFGTKYVTSDTYVKYEGIVNEYKDVEPSLLDDATLAEVTPQLVLAKDLLANVQSCCDALAYRAIKSAETATKLGVEQESLIMDAANAVTDDTELVDYLNLFNTWRLYDLIANKGGITEEMNSTVVSETELDENNEYITLTTGIDFTCYIRNPHMYTYATVNGNAITSETIPGWSVNQPANGGLHLRDGDFIATAARPVANSVLNNWCGNYDFFQQISGLPVGIYDVIIYSRTSANNNGVNDSTGIWDKYIWATVAEGDTLRTPFAQGGSWVGHPTVIKNVTVKEGTVLTIGATENYTSHKNVDEAGADKGVWSTNTFVDNARLYFVAPLDGFDYGQALIDDVTESKTEQVVSEEFYSIDGVRRAAPVKGVNVVKSLLSNGKVKTSVRIYKK